MRIEEVLAEYAPSNWRRQYAGRLAKQAAARGAQVQQAWVFDRLDINASAGCRQSGAIMEYLGRLTDSAAREKLAAAFAADPQKLAEFNLMVEIF